MSGTGATKVLEEDDHDMYFFFPKGSTQAQIAVVPIRPGEEEQLRYNQWYTGIFKRTNASDNSIEPNLFDAVNGLARQTGDDNLAYTLDKIGYKGLSKEEYEELHRSNAERARELINSRSTFTADDIDEIYDLFGIQLKVDGDRLVLHELDSGVWYQVYDSLGQNGVVEEDANELTHNFWTTMLNSVREIEGDCVLDWGNDTLGTVEYIGGNLEMESVYSLGNLKRVEGDVNLAGANNVSGEENLLGGLEYVGGDLDLSGSQITSLGNVQHVGGELLLERSGVTSLGNLNYVGSLPDIGISNVTDIGALEVVSGDANFNGGSIRKLGDIREIWGQADFRESTLEDLGALEFVGGDVLLEGAAVGTLGNLKRVNGNLNIEYTGVEDLGALEYIGNNAEFAGSLLKSMGKLKHVGGILSISDCDNLTSLGDLEGIDGNLYVGINWALENMGKLRVVEGDVDFSHASAISLDEQKAFAYRANIGGTITFSDETKIEGKDTKLDLHFSAEERGDTGNIREKRISNRELEKIQKAAAKDGTLGLALNGKPSALYEKCGARAWAIVRTPQFKNWFGNWDDVARLWAIQKVQPTDANKAAKNIEEKEGKDITSDRNSAFEFYMTIGTVQNKADKRYSRFPNTSFMKCYMMDKELFLKTIPAIKESFENSILAYTETEDKYAGLVRGNGSVHKEHKNIKAYHNYVGKVEIDGVEHYIRFTVAEDKGNHSVTHSMEVTEVEIYDEKTAPNTLIVPPLLRGEEQDRAVDANLLRFFESARDAEENCSKFLDENGEPKVFYHNTPSQFTVFDEAKNGTYTNAGWLGDGFYFYGDEYEGSGYGSNKMSVFLNVKDPYYATQEDSERLAEADSRDESIRFREELEGDGYDGVYYGGDLRQEAVVFSPNQIKSVDNNGDFSTENNDIRYSAEERELSDADTRETVSDIENPEGDTRFSATERVATADEARERMEKSEKR